jgi:small subunit ribosomal protein S9
MTEKKQKTIHVSGKRKRAIARITLKPGKGVVKINKLSLDHYKPEVARLRIQEPLFLSGDAAKKVDIHVNVSGGGWSAQTDATRVGIGKAMVHFQPSLKKTFLDYDRSLIVNDVRRNEPHKPNDSKPRRARQKSYR